MTTEAKNYQLCGEPIYLEEMGPLWNTYCMLPTGHAEPHSPYVKYLVSRDEASMIPQGVSMNETDTAYYIRIRRQNNILTFTVNKELLTFSVRFTHASDS